MFSNFLRFLVRRAQKQNPEKIKIEFRNYSKKIVKVYFNFRFIEFEFYEKKEIILFSDLHGHDLQC